MAFFGGSTSSLLFALFVLLAVNPSSARFIGNTDATTEDLLGSICSGTLDPPFCSKVIKDIPEAAQASRLDSLGQAAIPFAHSKGEETHKYVQSLVGSATNPRLKENYGSCADNYNEAVGILEEAQGMFKSKDYPGVSIRASACMTEVDTCKESFKESGTTDPSQLPQKNEYFNMLCVIILRVANKLGGAA
ncbi:pectinesterase inhibitor-like [Punica granatum]|uniref:Pectinesterase inhibitor domain-containing protein n=2 Tax=Punica granatum TaxID=22663 RepID=A0A218XT57_PUNGR|nr:pectinesterase inhibitor-like [Punica granatum]OWM88010.1 hypothetical protein CDL15_Pgr016583 [Punica granatum]PKI62670.1 hypothetical protein CRG98_016941 [Punica granatum]